MALRSEYVGGAAIAPAEREGGRSSGLRPEAVAAVALVAFVGTLMLNLVAIFAIEGRTGGGLYNRIAKLLLFDSEGNFPTLFNYLLLVGITALAAILAVRAFGEGNRWRYHWAGLAVLFLLMSFDEAAQMHEQLKPIVNRFVEAKGIFYFSWVIPGFIFALVVVLAYLRFVLALPRRTAWLAIVGGGMYLTGSLGFEMVGGEWATAYGMGNAGFLLLATVEESLEMLGLIVFGYGLLRLLAGPDGRLRLQTRPAPGRAAEHQDDLAH